MIKEALWDGMDGWDWMVIIGHRYSESTFGANKVRKKVKGPVMRSPLISRSELLTKKSIIDK